jgi:hypothetical protein
MRVALFFSLTAIPVVVKISGDSNYRGDGGGKPTGTMDEPGALGRVSLGNSAS